MAHRKLPHVVCYDIRCPKRLGRVHRYLKRRAIPLQYSVFLVELDDQRCQRLLRGLQDLIDPRKDDVRVYVLPSAPDWCMIGKSLWPAGLTVTGAKLPSALFYKLEQP